MNSEPTPQTGMSPYAIGSASQVATLALIVGGLALNIAGVDPLIGLLVVAAGGLTYWIGYSLSRCGTCGKPTLALERDMDSLARRRRACPERACSRCGTRLNGL